MIFQKWLRNSHLKQSVQECSSFKRGHQTKILRSQHPPPNPLFTCWSQTPIFQTWWLSAAQDGKRSYPMCILYNQATYTIFFIIISVLHDSGGFFRPLSGAYKTVCAALGIVILSYCLPLVWMGCNLVPTHLLIMGGKPARNVQNAENNTENCTSCISLVI